MTKKNIYAVWLLIFYNVVVYSQEPPLTANTGILSVSTDEIVSFQGTFENQEQGEVINDGIVIYFMDFFNQGYYGLTPNKKTSKTLFLTEGATTKAKEIKGKEMTTFYDVEFNSAKTGVAFDLGTNIDVYGTVNFQEGIIKVDSVLDPTTGVSKGMFSFQHGSKATNASNRSHISGQIEKIGNEFFQFPQGDEGHFRYARISAPKDIKDAFVTKYIYGDTSFFNTRTTKAGVVKEINEKEYWLVDKGSNTTSDVLLTISWEEGITPPNLLQDPEGELHIVRWDAHAQIWVDEGGAVDMSTKEVTTIATVKGYGFFTLATVKKDWFLDGDVIIYNLVTPDGDGKNEYFLIDKIQNYPNNKVEIFNRWGTRVYETTQYDPNGDGSVNVFKGYSDGKVTIDKGSKLASGTYYYVVTYEYKDENGSRMVKKAANLHLETN